MAEFKYEVVAEYAAQKDGNIKVRSVAFNGREPKIDVRKWTTKDGKEQMGKGITLTMEDLVWLAEALPEVVETFTGKKKSTKKNKKEKATEEEAEDEDEEPEKESSKAVELMNYVIELEKKNEPKRKFLHGVMHADGKTIGTNGSFSVILNGNYDLEEVDTIPNLVTQLNTITANEEVKGFSIGEINKFKAAYKKIKKDKKMYYGFGEGKPTVDVRYLGKSLEAIDKGKIRYAKNGIITVSNEVATSVILPVKNSKNTVGLIEA